MKPLLYLILPFVCLTTAITTQAQQVPLQGQISIHNSKYKTGAIQYVENAQITAPFSTPTTSDSQGKFDLSFAGVEGGQLVDLSVEKAGLEVVNRYDLQRVVLGRKPLLRVYLAKSGALAQAQTELYNISKQALFARKDALIAQLQSDAAESAATLQELQDRFGKEIASRLEAERLLEEEVSKSIQRLPRFALELAAKNLDFASDLYIEAYEAFKLGELEEVIQLLKAEKLDLSPNILAINQREDRKRILEESISKEREVIIEKIDASFLKAEALNLKFEYRDAIKIYEKLIRDLSVDSSFNLELGAVYSRLSFMYYNYGQYDKADSAIQKAFELFRQTKATIHELAAAYTNAIALYGRLKKYDVALQCHKDLLDLPIKDTHQYDQILVSTYNNMGSVYLSLSKPTEALESLQKALELLNSLENTELDPIMRLNIYNNMGVCYTRLGQYGEAHRIFDSAISAWDTLTNTNHPDRAKLFNNKGTTFLEEGQEIQAISHFEKAIGILEQALPFPHPTKFGFYLNLALTQKNTGKHMEAIPNYHKAISIGQTLYGPDSPKMVEVYSNYGYSYSRIGNQQKALEHIDKAYSILKTQGDSTSLLFAGTIDIMGGAAMANSNYSKALGLTLKGIEIREKLLARPGKALAISYNQLGLIYFYMKDYKRATVAHETSVEIWEAIAKPDNIDLAITTENLALDYYQHQEYRKALKALKKALETKRLNGTLPPQSMANTWRRLGICYLKLNKYKEAIHAFEKTKELVPKDKTYYIDGFSMAYLKSKQLELAKPYILELQEIYPNSPLSYRDWTIYYSLKGEVAEALEMLQKAVELGFADVDFLTTEKAFAPIRKTSGFKEIIVQLQREK